MEPHSSTLAWKIPWAEEPGRLQSMASLRVGHDWVTSLSLFTFMHWRSKWQPTPVFLPGESQGRGSLVSLVDSSHDWSDLAVAELPFDPVITLLGVYRRIENMFAKAYIQIFIAEWFLIAKRLKQLKCPSTTKEIYEMWLIHIITVYCIIFILGLCQILYPTIIN